MASFTSSCPRGKCSFDASASSDDHGIVTYSWDFGDGSAASTGSALTKVTHAYKAAGTYVVTLKVTDTSGQQASTSQTLKIRKV